MKKLFLTITLLLCLSSQSQIRNLSDLLEISNLTVYGLTENLQGVWDISKPVETLSKDRKIATDRFTYSYTKGGSIQILHRSISIIVESPEVRIEKTEFVYNDQDLLKLIKKDLPYRGYELRTNKPHYLFYNNGKNSVAITDSDYEEAPLAKGYYMITVFIH